jgi:hypothetical protein
MLGKRSLRATGLIADESLDQVLGDKAIAAGVAVPKITDGILGQKY